MDQRNFQVFKVIAALLDPKPNRPYQRMKDTCRNHTRPYDAIVRGVTSVVRSPSDADPESPLFSRHKPYDRTVSLDLQRQ